MIKKVSDLVNKAIPKKQTKRPNQLS